MTLPYTGEEMLAVALQCGIPSLQAESLAMYLVHGLRPGQFLTAVLSNDLLEACRRADDENRALLWQYVAFLDNYAPAIAWGSPATVTEWIARGGFTERARREA